MVKNAYPPSNTARSNGHCRRAAIVKVIVPPGYQLVKEEDKNVDFGEEYIPQQFYLSASPCRRGPGRRTAA